MTLTLISHPLCPYVQRAAIALAEKDVPFLRRDIDLADKPDWFLRLSPLGKTPVLLAGDRPIFESAVIVEYLEETTPPALHPADPLERARHRGWIELASAVLNDIAGLYSARDPATHAEKRANLARKFDRLEAELGPGPYFDGDRFSLVDCAFGPVFRYFDVFEALGEPGFFEDCPKLRAWRAALAVRPSVRGAVGPDYETRLRAFLEKRPSTLGALARAA